MFSERFTNALTFAAQLHATQTRKGGEVPYIAHKTPPKLEALSF